MIDKPQISSAVRLRCEAAAKTTIIPIGSHAHREAGEQSDLDVLLIKPELLGRHDKMVRRRDVLRPLRVPADVLVVSEKTSREGRDIPGHSAL